MSKAKTKTKAKSSTATKKAAPKKAAAKKPAVKKAPVKAKPKASAKPAKKPIAKKPVVKKAAAPQKPAAKKTAPKKTAPKKAAPKKAAAPVKATAKKAAPKKVEPKAKVKDVRGVQPEVKAKAPKKAKVVEVEVVEELDEELEEFSPVNEAVEEVILTDAEGRRYCRVRDCDQLSSVDGYCRYHYLLFWKRIQVRKKILTEGKLERYVEDLTGRYPDKFLEMLRKDLRSEKEFLAAIQELEIDEGGEDGDFEDEDQSFIDEVRGMSETSGGREDEDY